MKMNKSFAGVIALLAASAASASAQSYPDRPIKVVVPYPAGGPTDTIARTVTQSLSAALGQSIVIENQSGAGGRIALKQVANAPPDGYTLLLGGTNNNAITPALYKDLDFDAVKDFAPVAAIATDSLVLVVNPSVPAGASNPYHTSVGKPSMPASFRVGTSGSSGQRVALATTSARSLPAWICGSSSTLALACIWIWPEMASVMAGAAPR